jgi:hypothetical protein
MWFHMGSIARSECGNEERVKKKIALWCNFRIDEGTALKAFIFRLPASTNLL